MRKETAVACLLATALMSCPEQPHLEQATAVHKLHQPGWLEAGGPYMSVGIDFDGNVTTSTQCCTDDVYHPDKWIIYFEVDGLDDIVECEATTEEFEAIEAHYPAAILVRDDTCLEISEF